MKYVNTVARRWASIRRRWGVVAGLAVLGVALSYFGCARNASLGVAKFVSPQYPYVARVYHLTGLVNLRVQIGPDGKVVSAKGSGAAHVLVDAGERNVSQWQFHVPRSGLFPVVLTVVYDFKLVGKPSVVGLTKAELISPNRVCIEDQPVSEHVPEGIPAGGILDCSSEDCVDILVLRDCYSKHCANQTTGPTDKVSLRELFDCFSKHCK